MNDTKIAALLAELDGEVPKEGAAVIFRQHGGGPDESEIVANRGGYLRLGIELMKGAVAVPAVTHGPHQAPVDIEYLVSEDSDVGFESFELAESTVANRYEPSRSRQMLRKVIGLLFAAAVLAIIGLAIIGAVSVLK